jgi:hypothetical protein
MGAVAAGRQAGLFRRLVFSARWEPRSEAGWWLRQEARQQPVGDARGFGETYAQ